MKDKVEGATSLSLDKLNTVLVGSDLAREVARTEQERAYWQQAVIQSIGATQQLKEAAMGSAYSQIAKDLAEFRSTASVIGQQYEKLMAASAPVAQALKVWQESQREQQERIRRMLEPLADIRKSFMVDDSIHRQLREAAVGSSIRDHLKKVMAGFSGIDSAAQMWAQQLEGTRTLTRNTVLERITQSGALKQQLKDFEQINKQWRVPPELLNVVASLREVQSQVGKVALPTIDWGSAAALAKLLGEEGVAEQLAHLGIGPDGTLHEPKEAPEKGLLSRKQSDAVALLGLLLSIISMWMALQMFCYQESAGAVQQAKNDEQAAKQLRQLESLSRLVEQALEQATEEQEERFVVRERPATVRLKPEHGSAVDGKLMPNEVVRAIDKEGKWVQVEYYHWLREEYRSGWVLKKYLERVPANHSKTAPTTKP